MVDLSQIVAVLPLIASFIPEPLKVYGFSLHLRQAIIKALGDGKLDAKDLPFAVEALPDGLVPIQGRLFPLKDTLVRIIADGKFTVDDLLTAYSAWSGAPLAPVVFPPVGPPPRPTPEVPPVPAPAGPQAPPAIERVFPDELTLGVHHIAAPSQSGVPQATIPHGFDANGRLVRTDGVDSLTERTTIWLDLGVRANGQGLRIDKDPRKTPPGEVNHPEFLGRQVYRAYDVASGKLVASIGGKGLDDLAHFEDGASFVPQRYFESGGMSANLRLKGRFLEGLRIVAALEGEDVSLFTMAVR